MNRRLTALAALLVLLSSAASAQKSDAEYCAELTALANKFVSGGGGDGKSFPDLIAEVTREFGVRFPPDVEDQESRKLLALYATDLRPVPGIAGALRDASGGYALPFYGCMALQGIAAALVIALISFMEAMSSCKVIAIKTRTPWNENQELIGQGLAKIASAFSHSIPVSGSFSRSALNLSVNAATGLSSVISAACVLLTLLFFTPLLHHPDEARHHAEHDTQGEEAQQQDDQRQVPAGVEQEMQAHRRRVLDRAHCRRGSESVVLEDRAGRSEILVGTGSVRVTERAALIGVGRGAVVRLAGAVDAGAETRKGMARRRIDRERDGRVEHDKKRVRENPVHDELPC